MDLVNDTECEKSHILMGFCGSSNRRYRKPMADSSFDVVSKVDRMELDNALNQASREVSTRFDFKDTGVKIEMAGEKILVEAETEERAKAALEVLKEKMVKRGVSLKHLEIADPQQSGKIFKILATIKEGISQDNAKKITKLLKDEGPKSVKAQIQGDAVRVSSKSKDDLQQAITVLKGSKLDFALQFTNYR